MSVFERVARSVSLTQAAADLGISQPALSRTIRLLEEELGVPLFFRTGRGVALTQGGQVFLEFCVDVLESMRSMRVQLEELSETLQGNASIAMPTGIASIAMVPFVTRFNEMFPAARVHVTEAFTGDVVRQLSKGSVDIGVIYSSSTASGVQHDKIVAEDLFLVGPVDGPAVQDAEIALKDAVRWPLILPTRTEGIRGLVNRELASLGLEANITLEMDATVSLMHLVRQKKGYCLFPYCVVKQEVESGEFRASRIMSPRLTRDIAMSTTTSHPLPPVARQAARLLRLTLLEQAEAAQWYRREAEEQVG